MQTSNNKVHLWCKSIGWECETSLSSSSSIHKSYPPYPPASHSQKRTDAILHTYSIQSVIRLENTPSPSAGFRDTVWKSNSLEEGRKEGKKTKQNKKKTTNLRNRWEGRREGIKRSDHTPAQASACPVLLFVKIKVTVTCVHVFAGQLVNWITENIN